MRGRDVLALTILGLIGILLGGLALWFILNYLPLILAIILAVIVAFVVVVAVAAFVGFFTAAVGALYYSLTKKPRIAGRPIKMENVEELDKERGTFRREEDSGK